MTDMQNLLEARVTVVGLGIEGIDLVRFLTSEGARVTVSDARPPEQLVDQLAAIEGTGARLSLGANRVEDCAEADAVFVSQGVPDDLPALRAAEAKADDLPRVRIKTSAGDLVVELFENEAPNTVANFVSLVEKGYYAGTPFHRVIPEFMAQGGDPTGSGAGGPGHAIDCEVDLPSARKHFLGSMSMAHAGANTGGSQFFLTFRPTDHLDGKHTVFGRIIEGFEVLPKLNRTQNEQGQPVPGIQPDKIVKATVLRKRDHAYEPKTLPNPRK